MWRTVFWSVVLISGLACPPRADGQAGTRASDSIPPDDQTAPPAPSSTPAEGRAAPRGPSPTPPDGRTEPRTPAPAEGQGGPRTSASLLLDLPSVELVVPVDVAGQIQHETEVKLPPALLDAIGAGGIEWDPRPGELGAELISLSDGRTVTLGPAGAPGANIEVQFSRPKLRADGPGLVTLSVPDPAGLRDRVGPGIFRGRVLVRLYHPALHNGQEPLIAPIPVELVIHGRRLAGASFVGEVGGAMQAGQGPAVEVVVESLGVEPGRGRLELDWAAEDGGPARLLAVPLPMPVDAWTPLDAREGWACHPEWLSSLIVAAEPRAEEVARAGDAILGRQVLRLGLPALFGPGRMSGRVTWEQPGGGGPSPSAGLPEVAVRSGLVVAPRPAFVGEAVRVDAVISRAQCPDVDDWGSQLALVVDGPEAPDAPILLERDRRPGVGPASFVGWFVVPTSGEYRLGLAPDAPASARLALGGAATLRAPMQLATSIPDNRPLWLFTGAPPIYWDMFYSAADGASRELRRPAAIALYPQSRDLRSIELRLLGVYEMVDGRAGRPIDPRRDPRVFFVGFGQQDGAAAGLDGPGRPDAAEAADPDRRTSWPVPDQDYFALDLVAALDPADAGDDRRGSTTWMVRWAVVATGPDGQPVARLIEQPIPLRVGTASDHAGPYGLVFLAIAGSFAVLLAVIWVKTRGRGAPTTSGGPEWMVTPIDETAPWGDPFAPDDDAETYHPDGPAGRAAGGAAGRGSPDNDERAAPDDAADRLADAADPFAGDAQPRSTIFDDDAPAQDPSAWFGSRAEDDER